MQPKTLEVGGVNDRQIHLIGPVTYGQLTLKRGMTSNLQLWQWFAQGTRPGSVLTAHGEITLWAADGTPAIQFTLNGCLPVRLRAPGLNARDGLVAIEELALVYQNVVDRGAGRIRRWHLDRRVGGLLCGRRRCQHRRGSRPRRASGPAPASPSAGGSADGHRADHRVGPGQVAIRCRRRRHGRRFRPQEPGAHLLPNRRYARVGQHGVRHLQRVADPADRPIHHAGNGSHLRHHLRRKQRPG